MRGTVQNISVNSCGIIFWKLHVESMAARHNIDDDSNNSTWEPITPGAVNVSDTNFHKVSTTRDVKLKANENVLQENNTSDVAKDKAVTYESTNDSTTTEFENVLQTDFQENISTTENTNTLDEYALETNKDSKNNHGHTSPPKINIDNEGSMKGAIRDLGTSEKNNEGILDGSVISVNKNPTEKEGISENRSAETIRKDEKLAHDKILSVKEMTENNFESSTPKDINCDKEEDGRHDTHSLSHIVVDKNATSISERDESRASHKLSNISRATCKDESDGRLTTHDLSGVTITGGRVNYAMFPNILPQTVHVLQRDVFDNQLRRYLEDELYESVTKETSGSLKEHQGQEINLDDFVEISLEVNFLNTKPSLARL